MSFPTTLFGLSLLAITGAGCAPGAHGSLAASRETRPGRETSVEALAFPGAVGWAATTPGGRGGAILRVTTLDGDGPGSLAEALAASGPRIVVFEVGGVIDLDSAHIEVVEPFLTVAGQTAPSPGITLIRGGITIQTHDVVVQHIRVRPGEAGAAKTSGWEIDALSTGSGAHDVIIDHCSTTWATDENLSASGTRFGGKTPDDWRQKTSHRVTISHSIIAEGLSQSTHGKGEHSKGSLIHDNATDIAIVGNLYASNVERSPLFKGGARGVIVNNYIHNAGKTAIKYNLHAQEWGAHPFQTGQMVVVGNVFTYGPNTSPGAPLVYVGGDGPCQVYLEDNTASDRAGQPVPPLGGKQENIVPLSQRPFWPKALAAIPAGEVRAAIEKDVGARPWDRDAIDARIVREALSGGGKIIDSERDVEGYPSPPPSAAPFRPAEWDLDTMTRLPGGAR
ncbi:MAG TPA: right-handed parallel beta-helix repeat-containing protein [Polyangiaceae bacterium]